MEKLELNDLEIIFEPEIGEISLVVTGIKKAMTISFNSEELDILIPWLQAKRAEM